MFYVGVGVQIDSSGAKPLLEGKPGEQLVSLSDWWNQTMLVVADGSETITFTRKSLLLTLANKEGGAHVDPALPEEYEKYVLVSPLKVWANGVESDTFHLARFCAVESGVKMMECLERNFGAVLKSRA
jgi:hypothetical protein